jgi:hypothetical protein
MRENYEIVKMEDFNLPRLNVIYRLFTSRFDHPTNNKLMNFTVLSYYEPLMNFIDEYHEMF